MRLLFLCTGNSCRSQMAEGYARQLLPAELEIFSAGIIAQGLNPRAVEVMREDGIDITTQTSNTVEKVPWDSMDWVITLCGNAAETCPAIPRGAEHRHWPLQDPYDATGTPTEQLAVYRLVRDEIRHRIKALATILPDPRS